MTTFKSEENERLHDASSDASGFVAGVTIKVAEFASDDDAFFVGFGDEFKCIVLPE